MLYTNGKRYNRQPQEKKTAKLENPAIAENQPSAC